jgi:hypothetical protein
MSLITKQTIFYINSRNRISGNDSDFLYKIDIPKDSKYDKVCCLQMSIPKSYYLIKSGEYFILQEDGKQAQIYVGAGNYTRKSFATILASALTFFSPNGLTYTVGYDTLSTSVDTGKYKFQHNSLTIQAGLIFDGTNDIYEHMGFDNNSNNKFTFSTLISKNVINLQRESTLYLHSDIVNNGNDSILQEVFATTTSDYSSIVFQQMDVEAYSKDITTNTNNVYRFYLSDENDKAIDLNGLNMVFTIVLYQKNNIYEMIKQFLKLQVIKK